MSDPPASAFTPAGQDETEHTTHIYAPRVEQSTLRSVQGAETVSFKDIPTTVRRVKYKAHRPWHASVVPFGAAFAIVLGGFLAGHAVVSRSPAVARAKNIPAPATQQQAANLSAAAAPLSAPISAQKPIAPEPTPTVKVESIPPAPAEVPAPIAGPAALPPAAPAAASTPATTVASVTMPTPASAKAEQPKPAPTTALTGGEHAASKSTAQSLSKSASSKPATPEKAASTIATQPGAVFVTTPGGGDVYDRGRLLGHAPAEFELSPGWHTLVVKSGADNRTVTVQVPAGAAIMVSVPASSKP